MKPIWILGLTLMLAGTTNAQVALSEVDPAPVAQTWSERVQRLQATTPARIVVQTTLDDGQSSFVRIDHHQDGTWTVSITVPKKTTRVYDKLSDADPLPDKAGMGSVSASTLWRWVTGAEPYANPDAKDPLRPESAGYVHHQVHFSQWAFNPEAGLTMPSMVRVQQTQGHQMVRDQTFQVYMFALGAR